MLCNSKGKFHKSDKKCIKQTYLRKLHESQCKKAEIKTKIGAKKSKQAQYYWAPVAAAWM